MKETAAPRRLALIDRDGTIIVDKVYLSDPDGIEFAPGAIEGLRLLRDAGFALVLITNQSGIARGYFDAATLDPATGNMKAEFVPNSQMTELPWDYLHPNHAGYLAMAGAVDIAPFKPR